MKTTKENYAVFNHDVLENDSYAYTKNKLSSVLATKRIFDALNTIYPLKGKRLLDLGCGDGAHSLEFIRREAKSVLAQFFPCSLPFEKN